MQSYGGGVHTVLCLFYLSDKLLLSQGIAFFKGKLSC
jgi:hypothetical protein